MRLETGVRKSVVFATLLSVVASASAYQCRTIKFNPAPRIFNAPTWNASGDRLLLVDIAAGEIESYSLSGDRERAIIRPGQDRLDFSTPNTIFSTPSGYVLKDGGSRFVLLNRDLTPIQAFAVGGDPPTAWDAATFQW